MKKAWGRPIPVFICFVWLLVCPALLAQTDPSTLPDDAYGTRFFEQLRRLFGQFKDADLSRAFQTAQPIPCSELVEGKGEWREVAFFNDNRKLGDWYRTNLDEVKTDLAVYAFKGTCASPHSPVQLATRFPVTESIDAYNDGSIDLSQIAINENPPVQVAYDLRSQAYTFELPYLFLLNRENGSGIYSLNPPRLATRDQIDPAVTDHWDCKAVRAADVTYQFLICRTSLLASEKELRTPARREAFGSSAYFILSDGNEAFSTVQLSFGDAPPEEPVKPAKPESDPPLPRAVPIPRFWQLPDSRLAIADVGKDPFRIRFNPQEWTGRIGAAQVLSGQRMSSLDDAKPAEGADYCIWLPGSGANTLLNDYPDQNFRFTVKTADKNGTTPASIIFDIISLAGAQAGRMQCYFPRVQTASTIGFNRWIGIVGDLLLLEVNR